MSLSHLSLETITETEIGRLIESGARESKSIEYKLTLNVLSDEQKREFLFDIASLANSGGGDLVFGLKASDGVPIELVGLDGYNPDKEQLRIEDLLRACISPRLNGVRFQTIPTSSKGPVLIIRVPRSLGAPHLVRHGSWTRFYGRNSAGKYELDVHEIRTAFLAGESATEVLREFRLKRLGLIRGDQTGIKLCHSARIVLHIMPIEATRPGLIFDLPVLKKASQNLKPPGQIGSWGPTTMLEGLSIRSDSHKKDCYGYALVFRNGFIESTDAHTLSVNDNKIVAHILVEQAIRETYEQSIATLRHLNLMPPYVVGLSWLNVKGYAMAMNPGWRVHGMQPLNIEDIVIPEFFLEDESIGCDQVVRPLCDQVWNAFGIDSSPNFDQQTGAWNPRLS